MNKDLNFPKSIALSIKNENGSDYVFDINRKKYVLLTPEEEVRQKTLRLFTDFLGYPLNLMAIEKELIINHLKRRPDLVIYRKDGTPWMIVECKAPGEKLNSKVVDQIAQYNSLLGAAYLVITNGMQHVIIQMNYIDNSIVFLKDFPKYRT